MVSLRPWRAVLRVAAVLSVVAASAPVAQASIIQSSPSLPPNGWYTAPTLCLNLGGGVCIVGAALKGFNGAVSIFDQTGQSVDASTSLDALVYTDVNNMPGMLIGPLSLSGPIGIFYAGRMDNTETGTWTSSLTELDLMGMFNGHSIEVILNPSMTSSGPTTVMPFGNQFPDGEFQVSSFFDVFVEISIDHGGFMAGPMRTFTLTPTPEPGSVTLLALGVLGITGKLRRRLRS